MKNCSAPVTLSIIFTFRYTFSFIYLANPTFSFSLILVFKIFSRFSTASFEYGLLYSFFESSISLPTKEYLNRLSPQYFKILYSVNVLCCPSKIYISFFSSFSETDNSTVLADNLQFLISRLWLYPFNKKSKKSFSPVILAPMQ